MSFRLHSRTIVRTASYAPSAPLSAPTPSDPAAPGASFRDVHEYDYTYREAAYRPKVEGAEKAAWMDRLRARMTRPLAIAGLDLIRANQGGMGNLDTTNGKRAEDLLADLAKHIFETESDLLALLEEQLEDMYSLGQCAQGRTTRLWQLLSTTF